MAESNGNGHKEHVSNSAPPDGMPEVLRERFNAQQQGGNPYADMILRNAMMERSQFFSKFMDPRRDINRECGYPSTYATSPDAYRELYDREPIATRVVQLMSKECWQVTPRVFEDEDGESATEFEDAWDELGKAVRTGQSWYQDEEGSPVWEYLRRADELSGIGHFGVILLGIDDGKPLNNPVEGVMSYKPTGNSAKDFVANLSVPTKMPKPEEMVENLEDPSTKTTRLDVKRHARFTPGTQAVRPTLNEAEDRLTFNNASDGQVNNEYGTIEGVMAKLQPGIMGTDAQYVGVQLSQTEFPADKPAKGKQRKLTFLRAYGEDLVQIVQFEANINNPRFGLPVMYRITLNDSRDQYGGVGLSVSTLYVHWSRVIHLADNLGASEIFGVPRMRPVLNPLLDIRKIRGSGAEGYWQACFAGISLETNPQLGGEVPFDANAIKDMMENYTNGLQRWLGLVGMQAKTIAPTVTDPTPHIAIQIEAVCIQLGCPVRVFKGSERGELASSQDDSSWNDRLKQRQNGYVTPRVIVPFIDRLISIGILPEPEGYSVEWPDLDSISDKDKATIALTKVQTIQAYVSGQCETTMTPLDFWTKIMGMDEEEANSVVENTTKAHEKLDTMTIPPLGEQGHPATVPPPPEPPVLNPVKLGAGQTMVPHPDNPNASKQKPFTAPGKPKPPTRNVSYDRLEEFRQLVQNWCNQYGGTTCRDGSAGAKANDAKAKGQKVEPTKATVSAKSSTAEKSKARVDKAHEMVRSILAKGKSKESSKAMLDHLHTMTVKELKEVKAEHGLKANGSTKQKFIEALKARVEAKAPSKIDTEVRSFASNVRRIRAKEESSGVSWIQRVLKGLEPAGQQSIRDGITRDTPMMARHELLKHGKVSDETLSSVLGSETFRHDYGSMTLGQFKSTVGNLRYDTSSNRETQSGRLTPEVLRRSFADHRQAIGAAPKSAATPQRVATQTFRLLPATKVKGPRHITNAEQSIFTQEYLDALADVLCDKRMGGKGAVRAVEGMGEDELNLMIAMSPTDDPPTGNAFEQYLVANQFVDNSFCPTGDGGGVDPTCSPSPRSSGSGEGSVHVEEMMKYANDGTLDQRHLDVFKENVSKLSPKVVKSLALSMGITYGAESKTKAIEAIQQRALSALENRINTSFSYRDRGASNSAESEIESAVAAHDSSEWFRQLATMAVESMPDRVSEAIKLAEEFFAANPDGGEDEEEDDMLEGEL